MTNPLRTASAGFGPCMAGLGLALSLVLTAAPALATPALVVLIRHGHKDRPAAPAATLNYNLSETGLLQALQLGRLVPACLLQGRPLHLVSHGFNTDTGKNARSYQTLVPLAVATGVNIRVFDQAITASESIGRQLLQDPAYHRGVIVVAWEHRRLPELARGFGWEQMAPVEAGDFDSLWLLQYRGESQRPHVALQSQLKLQDRPCYRDQVDSHDPLGRVIRRLQGIIK